MGDALSGRPPPSLLVVCTGNVARSVMAASMLTRLAGAAGRPLCVATAGTHALEGQPAGRRTQEALWSVPAMAGVALGDHRSVQLGDPALVSADLVVAMEADHVRFVRRRHPAAAAKTATLRRLCRDLPPATAPLAERVGRLGLEDADVDAAEDVADPAGGDDAAYRACAAELWTLCRALARRL